MGIGPLEFPGTLRHPDQRYCKDMAEPEARDPNRTPGQ